MSFGLKPLVKTVGTDSIFSVWPHPDKDEMVSNENHDLLQEYVKFCVAEINMILLAARKNLPDEVWTTNKSVDGRMLTTTNINCLIICLRLLIGKGKADGYDSYNKKFKGLEKFKFKDYHSSQYNKMAEAIYAKFLAN